jgi:hypothetical protein
MDKIKLVLDFLKKWHFWFLSGSMVVVVLVCWWFSTNSLAKQFQDRTKAIDEQFSEVNSVVNTEQPPNQEYIEAVNKKREELKKGVLEVWQALYQDQQQKNLWPKEALGQDFVEEIKALGPGEKIPVELRERYQNYIKRYFPVLYKIIGLREAVEEGDRGAGGGTVFGAGSIVTRFLAPQRANRPYTAVEGVKMVGVVDWSKIDRDKLEERFNWTRTPNSLQVRLRQEDLWVYETLLRVISDTNGEAKDQSQAAVKRIDSLDIGADAVKAWSEADEAVFRAPTQQAEAGRRSADAIREGSGESKEDLLADRYVDDKGAPLAADAQHPFAEFKMMPISMSLLMDQRKITKLLAACANRAMPIEVRRVRLNPGKGEVLDFSSMADASPARTSTFTRSPFDRGRTYRSLATSRTDAGGSDEEEAGTWDMPVEIQGVIYIYNPPDQATLGTGAAGEKPPEASPDAEAGGAAAEGIMPAAPEGTLPAKAE